MSNREAFLRASNTCVLTCVLLSFYEIAARRLDLGLLLGRRYEYLLPARCTLVLVHPLSVFGKFTPASDGSLSLSRPAVSSRSQGSCSFACLVTELQGWPIRLWTGLSAPSDYLEHEMPQGWLKKGTAQHLRHRSRHFSSFVLMKEPTVKFQRIYIPALFDSRHKCSESNSNIIACMLLSWLQLFCHVSFLFFRPLT